MEPIVSKREKYQSKVSWSCLNKSASESILGKVYFTSIWMLKFVPASGPVLPIPYWNGKTSSKKLFDFVNYNCPIYEFYNEHEFDLDMRHFHGIKISGILAAYNLKIWEYDFGYSYYKIDWEIDKENNLRFLICVTNAGIYRYYSVGKRGISDFMSYKIIFSSF